MGALPNVLPVNGDNRAAPAVFDRPLPNRLVPQARSPPAGGRTTVAVARDDVSCATVRASGVSRDTGWVNTVGVRFSSGD